MKARQRGFSLIEVLITMLLMSIGLLGIAGIIATNLKNNHGAYARSQATLLANDIVERMRANRAAAEKAASPYAIAIGAEPGTGTDIPTADVREWRALLAASLPSGTGAVAVDADTRDVTVTIQWDDSRTTGDGVTIGKTDQTMIMETHL